MFILIIQFPSGFCSLLCHVGNQLTQLSHYPRTQHYTSYSLRRLFMMEVHQKQIKPFFGCIPRSYTYFRRKCIILMFSRFATLGRGQTLHTFPATSEARTDVPQSQSGLLVSDLRPWDPECSDTDSDIYKRHNISIHHRCHVRSGSEIRAQGKLFRIDSEMTQTGSAGCWAAGRGQRQRNS